MSRRSVSAPVPVSLCPFVWWGGVGRGVGAGMGGTRASALFVQSLTVAPFGSPWVVALPASRVITVIIFPLVSITVFRFCVAIARGVVAVVVLLPLPFVHGVVSCYPPGLYSAVTPPVVVCFLGSRRSCPALTPRPRVCRPRPLWPVSLAPILSWVPGSRRSHFRSAPLGLLAYSPLVFRPCPP